MFGPFNRAQLRDVVRRNMGQVPPIDTGAGIAGAQPVRNPWPNNGLVNMMLDDAVAFVSRKGNLSGDATPRLINVAAQTTNGPYAIPLSSIAPVLSINEVKRVSWYNSVDTADTLLKPDNRENMERDRLPTMSQQPATPQRYWQESSHLLIWPAPGSDGTLSLMLGQSLWSQSQTLDGELLELVPTDYIPLVTWRATFLVCATQPEDEVMRDTMALADRMVQEMLPDFIGFCQRRNRTFQGRMVPTPIRTGLMRRR